MANKSTQRSGGKTASLSNLKVTTRFIDSQYEIVQHDLTRTDTGLLKVFSLIPKSPEKPSFHARIDDGNPGNRRAPELDIDIEGVTNKAKRDFRANRGGYTGHHTDRSPNPGLRVFEVEVVTPERRVFEGDVSFNAHFSVIVEMGVYSTVSVGANLVRATWRSRLYDLFKQLLERIRAKL
jgi:hypothetical protein